MFDVTQISWMGQGGPGYCFIRNLSHKYPFPPSRLIYGYVKCLMRVFPRLETRSLLLCNAQPRQILEDAFQLPVLCVVMIINPWPGGERYERSIEICFVRGSSDILHMLPLTPDTHKYANTCPIMIHTEILQRILLPTMNKHRLNC